ADDEKDWTIDECSNGICTHEQSGHCWIGGEEFANGDANPANECEWCNPSASASNWTARPKGFECETDEQPCTANQCDGFGACEHPVFKGCFIDGTCVEDRAEDSENACMECNPALSVDRYSPKAKGELCDENSACDGSGHCFELPPGKCTIGDDVFDNGAANPANSCQRCDAFMNPGGWTNRTKGAACTNDGLDCTSNSCDGFGKCDADVVFGCLIGGKCVDVGAKGDEKCEECDPAFSRIGYGPSAPGTPCDGDVNSLNLCDGEGNCESTPKNACYIEDVWHDSGSINPDEPCKWCDPDKSETEWSQRPVGATCSSDGLTCTANACDSAGKCSQILYPEWCLIDDKCVGNHGPEFDEDGNVVDCSECNVGKSQDKYSYKPSGAICSSEEGDVKYLDTCDGDGVCHHDPRVDCRIGGGDVLGGALNPSNDCEWCSAMDNPGGWSLKAAGSECSTDGLTCTDDICDADGTCTHIVTTGCAIENECVAPGAASSADPCKVCDPAKSKTQWVHSESKECNPCTEDSECPEGEECVGGECVPEPECKTGVDCPPGQVCEEGVCVPKKPDCTDDDECPPNQVCVGGVCQNVTRTPECETDDQCPEGKECVNGDCKDIPSECRADSECPFGKCVDGECQSTLYVEGSGCGCRAVGVGASSVGGVSGLLGLLGLAWLRVRGGRREESC
ncbi:MAG: hypothetical protein FWD57_10100, partial [Polyangiaceae bacterium]|nr:hypothetical protein [Polyangiaceae bacterium]